jgi:hypothetical protein
MNISPHRALRVCLLTGALALAVALWAAETSSAKSPKPIDFDPEKLVGFCDFPVLLEVSGKNKAISCPTVTCSSRTPAFASP